MGKVHTDLVGDMMEIWDKYDTNKDNKLYVPKSSFYFVMS
jgi:hypothetical protein